MMLLDVPVCILSHKTFAVKEYVPPAAHASSESHVTLIPLTSPAISSMDAGSGSALVSISVCNAPVVVLPIIEAKYEV